MFCKETGLRNGCFFVSPTLNKLANTCTKVITMSSQVVDQHKTYYKRNGCWLFCRILSLSCHNKSAYTHGYAYHCPLLESGTKQEQACKQLLYVEKIQIYYYVNTKNKLNSYSKIDFLTTIIDALLSLSSQLLSLCRNNN